MYSSERNNGFDLESILSYMKENRVFSNIIIADKEYLTKLIEISLPDFHRKMLSKIKAPHLKDTAEIFVLKGFEGAILQWINSYDSVSASDEACRNNPLRLFLAIEKGLPFLQSPCVFIKGCG